MPRKRHKPEEIVAKLRQVDVLVAQGRSVADAVRSIGVTEVTYCRWRREFGGLKAEQTRRLKELEAENARPRRAVADLTLDKPILKEAVSGNCRAPRAAASASSTSGTSSGSPSAACAERSALGSAAPKRSTRRKRPRGRDDEEQLTADLIELARRYGRYGCRKVAEPLRSTAGWVVNDKRVERSTAALSMAPRGARGATQAAQARAALAGGRLVPAAAGRAPRPRLVLRLRRGPHPSPAGSGRSVAKRRGPDGPRRDGRKHRMLDVLDEFAHECLAIRVGRQLKATDVVDALPGLFLLRGVPGHIRSDNGPEFVATAVQAWITAVGARTADIAPGSRLQGRHRGPGPCGTGSAAALPMGGRLPRELRRPAPRRAARRRDLLRPARSSRAADRPGRDRELAAPLA
jgi:hypothetical protein